MSAPITEAHRRLAQSINGRWCSHDEGAQLIADSEARAVVEIAMVAAESADRNVSLRLERDELRAALTVAENWVEHHSQHADDLIAQNAELRAKVERLKADGAASAFINMSCRASRAETDRNNLRADLDAIKEILNEEKGRAERAEALLGKLQELHGCSQEMVVHWCAHAAERSQGLDQARAELATWHWLRLWGTTPEIVHAFIKRQQARIHAAQDIEVELAAELARLDWLLNITQPPVVHTTGWPYPDTRGTYGHRFIGRVYYESCEGRAEMTYFKDRAAIDAAMKEGAKL
jgi:hypothetical protein